MDIGELLDSQPAKPVVSGTKRGHDGEDGGGARRRKDDADDEREKMLKMVEEEPEAEVMNEAVMKRMVSQFEKKAHKNQEMRIKYPEMPEKFLESEMLLNDAIQELHVVATAPELYAVLVSLSCIHCLLQLLSHENTDISIATVDLLQEFTDVDTMAESDDGANALLDALMEGQIIAQLVQNMERLDESVADESEAIHNSLAIIENMSELRPEICGEATSQGLMTWLLKRLKAKIPFDANKLYASEMLAILLQNHEGNRQTLGEVDGIDVLLSQLAAYKRHDPASAEEVEMMENLFNCLCSSLMTAANRDKFLHGEGLQLMNLMLREKKLSRCSAVRVLNHALTGAEGADNCQKFVDILGLRSIFPLFMKTPAPTRKAGRGRNEMQEHIISVVAGLMHNCHSMQRQRLVNKFVENDHEKVDRLMELHFYYLEKMRIIDEKIEQEKQDPYGAEQVDELDDDFYQRRLDAGLFTLQFTDYVMLEICHCGPPSVSQRVKQILNMKGGSVKTIKSIMREYAGNIGDERDKIARDAEQQKILQLMDKF